MHTSGFMPKADGSVTLSVSGTSSNATLSTYGKQVFVVNKGASLAFIKLGDSSVTATGNDFPLARSATALLHRDVNTQTTIAAIGNAGTNTIVHAMAGDGDPSASNG